jgi:hypothetical protein
MNEKNARQILTLAAISSVTGLVLAIALGLRGQQDAAILFLVLPSPTQSPPTSSTGNTPASAAPAGTTS